jgi:hypothetical protein
VVVVPVSRRQRHRRTVYLKCTLPQEWAADAECRVHPARNRDDALYRRVKDPTCLAAVPAFMTA